jgi:hypothetical protein
MMPRPDPRCHACFNAGYLHMLGMGGGKETVIPCPECIAGKRFASFLRKLNSSPPTELQASEPNSQWDADKDIREEIQPHEDYGRSSWIHSEE